MALTNNFTDATSTATVHAQHHNDLATQVNALAGPLQPWVPSTTVKYCAPYTAQSNPNTWNSTSLVGTLARVPNPCTITAVSITITTGVAGASPMELFIHNDTGNLTPGTRLGTASIPTTASGTATGTLATPITFTQPTSIWMLIRCPTQGTIGYAYPLQGVFTFALALNSSAGSPHTVRLFTALGGSATVPTDLSGTTSTTTNSSTSAPLYWFTVSA